MFTTCKCDSSIVATVVERSVYSDFVRTYGYFSGYENDGDADRLLNTIVVRLQ